MSEYVFKLPDLGEGTVEAEIVEWHVNVGDEVKEGDVICDVMTDKANVEVPAPVDGKVLRTNGEPGDVIAVGSELIALEAKGKAAQPRRGERPSERSAPAEPKQRERAKDSEAPEAGPAESEPEASAAEAEPAQESEPVAPAKPASAPAPEQDADAEASEQRELRDKVITSPAIRRRAKEAGVDLRTVDGSGPRGRILRRDLEAALAGGGRQAARPAAARAASGEEFEETKVIGVRRVIAERMSQSKREIPHFAYVEEVDVTDLERTRRHLGEVYERRLTVLPFIAVALIRALEDFPQCNARYDAERGMLQTYRPVHLGIATQTDDGLKVPVVRDAQARNLWDLATEIARVAEGARSGKAGRNELSGSTITITSLGRMGGIVTTPVINYPEVGIIGVNKVVDRPVVVDGQVTVRTMMNLSSSFDHRFVDGFDAAAMIQRVKGLLEHPTSLFVPAP
jgi:2-oxoisovalerate dehydrogenase E2 component (dihydrolipoyl transacylase)